MFDFSTTVDRRGTWCTQWDYIADRFGTADLLPFTISDMDFPTAPVIINALQKRTAHGVFGYSRWKHDEFTGAIAHWFASRFSSHIDQESVVYAPSVIYMVAELIRQWSVAGDGVVMHTPAYDAFYKVTESNQRRVVTIELEKKSSDWHCDMAKLEAALARPENKILLLCSPQNPTGKVWSRDELQTMAQLCKRHNVKVISDEIHMDMVWGDNQHTPWSEVGSGEWALLSSASKSFNIPALTGAWGIINATESRNAFLRSLKERDGLSSPSVLSLSASIAAYHQGKEWLDALRNYLEMNLQYVADELNRAFPQLNWQPPQATYLAWIDLNPLHIDDIQLQKVLIERQKVAIMPGYTYGKEGRGYVRLNVGCPRSKLELGVQGLIAGIKELKNTVLTQCQ